MAAVMLFAVSSATHAQSFTSIPPIAFDTSGPVIQAHVEALKPFTVAGERGVLVGQQNGSFEAWVLPVKLLSHLTIEAEIEGYGVPIALNPEAAEIEVRPDRTVITYSHPGFTVRQIMFSPDEGRVGTGPIVLFEFDCLHPTDFTFSFTPELRWMWPERNEGTPGAEWVPGRIDGKEAPGGVGGYYVLHTDYPELAGAVTIPGAKPGIMAPYQERPQVHPVELKLHIDPERDRGRLFPLLMAAGTTPATATNAALGATLAELKATVATAYQAHAASYKKLLANSVSIETPDKALNEAFQWGVVSIEQLRAHPLDAHGSPTGETALVAGYYTSADSARPGFGWFFGRDSLYTLYAVNGYGDFALSKAELEFLIARQRADGKIMHEYSQTAASIDWQAFPYMYAAADSTPLFLMAVEDYVKASGDVAFLTAHREAIEKAWTFETTHDTDGDGIYDNSQGTGWVESWPGAMPHQEIYLALLDQQASQAYAGIQHLLGNEGASSAAAKRASDIAATIEKEYYDQQKGCYAFATNPPGTPNSPVDRTTTVYPALAWWGTPATAPLAHGAECLKQFAAHALNTDWGLRDVANDEKIYDGMSYHQGSVWPLFTGWAALAEYRGGQPLAGYQLLMENANLTRAQDLGAVTELLSGDYFVPFGRSTSHQLWSSAMVITPTLRGLFGIDIDAQTKTITVNPHLPADWEDAAVRNLNIGGKIQDLSFQRDGGFLTVHIYDGKSAGWKLRSDEPGSETRDDNLSTDGLMIAIPLPAVEIKEWTLGLTKPGDRTRRCRVVSEEYKAREIKLTVEAPASNDTKNADGTTNISGCRLQLLRNKLLDFHVKAADGVGQTFRTDGSAFVQTTAIDTAHRDPKIPWDMFFHMPSGEGWKTISVTVTW
jgi:glycogen debranching enzyme